MAHQSLYRRYRPQRFAELRGQEHLVRALQHAVQTDTVGHAYLFSGPRGTGKTSTARILAKVLNCENPIDGEPCGVCASCVAIEQGTSFDVHELDAASNNGVDAIRELVAKASLGTPGRTKVYILDEVHMLSTGASNALLKTLEEPPAHVVFVLATTDPQKVLPTIRSRTQHFEVHLLSADELTALAEFIIADAGLEVPEGAVDHVVRVGAGSARDMESALDQVVAAGSLPDDGEALDELVESLCERDTGRALLAVEAAIATGRAPRQLGEMLISRLRDVFLASMKADLARLPDRDRARVVDQAGRLGPAGATRALEVLGEAFVGIQDAPDQRIPLEVALVRLTRPDADTSLAALADRVARLERGGVVAPAASAAPIAATSAPDRGTPPTVLPDQPPPDPAIPPTLAPDTALGADAGGSIVEPSDSGNPDDAPVPALGSRPSSSAREVLNAKKQARSGSAAGPAARRAPAAKAAASAPPAPAAPVPDPVAPEPTPASSPPSRSDVGDIDAGPGHPSPERAPAEASGPTPAPGSDDVPVIEARSGRSSPERPNAAASGPTAAPGSDDVPVIEARSGRSSPERPDAAASGPTAAPDQPAAAAPAADPASTGSTGGLPTRDELTVAWGDSILASLPPRAKAFFSAGRFLDVTDRTAVFGLPNAVHMQKCENGKPDVEKALAAHFGRPVPLQLAVDDDAPPLAAPARRGATPPPPVPDESDIDLAELTDADVSTSSVDRVRELFPGAELVDPG